MYSAGDDVVAVRGDPPFRAFSELVVALSGLVGEEQRADVARWLVSERASLE
jgi:hypothetical protein